MSLLLLSSLLHLYIGARLVPALAATPAAWALAALLLASALLVPAGLLGRRRGASRGSDLLTWAGMLCLGLFSSLLVLTLLRDAVLALAWAAAALGVAVPADLAGTSAVAVAVLGPALTALGLLNARRTAGVVTVDVPIASLPPALEGLRIAQISDIHVGPTVKSGYVAAIVEAVNRLQADLVAITGDLVDGSVPDLGPHVAPLAGLRSRHGSFFVTGNHEYYSGAGPWIAELQRLGIPTLLNSHVVLQHDGAPLVLAGVTDYSAGHFAAAHASDPQAALRGAPPQAVKVLLAHQPRSAAAAEQAGFDLQISGHTHGGQFLPWNLFVRFQQPFTAGLHRVQRMWIYVSRGTGYWGPPKRLGAPSEITLLRLVGAGPTSRQERIPRG